MAMASSLLVLRKAAAATRCSESGPMRMRMLIQTGRQQRNQDHNIIRKHSWMMVGQSSSLLDSPKGSYYHTNKDTTNTTTMMDQQKRKTNMLPCGRMFTTTTAGAGRLFPPPPHNNNNNNNSLVSFSSWSSFNNYHHHHHNHYQFRRDFSVKNRQRKEAKRIQRKKQKKAQAKWKKVEELEREKKKTSKAAGAAAPKEVPVVTQTKAVGSTTTTTTAAGSSSSSDPSTAGEIKTEEGFVLAARRPEEDDDEEEFVSRFAMPDREKEKQISEMQSQVATLYKAGRYKEGLQIALETLQATEDHFTHLHPATASCYLNVGLFYKQLGEFDKSLQHYDKALQAYEETVGTGHESYSMVLHNKGILYQSRVHFDETLSTTDRLRMAEKAMESLEEALKIRLDELPTTHPYVVATQSALGMVLTSHVLSHHKRVFNPKDNDNKKTTAIKPDGGGSSSAIASGAAGYRSVMPAHVTEESWKAAEKHLREALQKAVQNPRGESSLKRNDKNHYLNIQKKYDLKKKLKENNEKVDVPSRPPEFPTQTLSAATASQNLAIFLKARSTTVDRNVYAKKYKEWIGEAKQLYQTALSVRKALLPTNHPDIYATQHSLAELYDSTGQDAEAEKIRETILESYYDEDEVKDGKKKKKATKVG